MPLQFLGKAGSNKIFLRLYRTPNESSWAKECLHVAMYMYFHVPCSVCSLAVLLRFACSCSLTPLCNLQLWSVGLPIVRPKYNHGHVNMSTNSYEYLTRPAKDQHGRSGADITIAAGEMPGRGTIAVPVFRQQCVHSGPCLCAVLQCRDLGAHGPSEHDATPHPGFVLRGRSRLYGGDRGPIDHDMRSRRQ